MPCWWVQVYDLAPVQLGPIPTSWVVPPLLGVFYIVLGTLTCLADNMRPNEDTRKQQQLCRNWQYILAGYVMLAAILQTSAVLYTNNVEYQNILVALGVISGFNYWAFDRTAQGISLAVLCATAAPVAELILMSTAHTWHYSRPDVAGGLFVSWVPWCYFAYTPALGNLARYLWQRRQPMDT
eukprot:jgi/Chrzof1/12826/Cz07g08260.t1